MAAVSAPFASASLTPPTNSHGAQSAWGYSESLENQFSSETTVNYHDHENGGARQISAGHTNGHSLSSKSSNPDLYKTRPRSRSNQLQNQRHLARIDITNQKMNGSGSEDNLSPDFQGRGAQNGTEYGSTNGGDYEDDEDPERSRWIHKDKLERMEHEEMERLGIRIPHFRDRSRSHGRSRSRDKQNSAYNRNDQEKRQKMESIPTDAEEEHSWDLRLPGERYEERDFQDPQWEQAAGSRSASRIPVNKKSPLPIPIDFIERDKLMQYGKTPASPGPEDAISYSKSRSRSGSVNALDDAIASTTSRSIPQPISGRRAATDMSPVKKTGPRKTSAPTGRTPITQQRPKTRSGSGSNGTRPVTRSGDLGSISKRPEGDPPWLATMYKPDPRLPPDQQILPTHAKRMQQEQWEKDGKFGNTYDTSFRPLNNEDYGEREQPAMFSEPVEVKEQKPESQSPESQPGWPLRSPKSPTLSIARPGTAGGVGSYSTMPKIPSPVRPQASPLPSPSATAQVSTTLRVPEPPAEDEKKKEAGCGCCIIM